MSSPQKKPDLILIPHYVGSLRYFERLKPFLEKKYTVSFLLLPLALGQFQREMIDYCNERGYLTRIVPKIGTSFFTTFQQMRAYKEVIRSITSNTNLKKIISVNDGGFPLDYIFKEARKKNIDTMVLQWAVITPGQHTTPPTISKNFFRRIAFYRARPLYLFMLKKIMELALGTRLDIGKKVIGGGAAERFGVMNTQTRNYLVSRGIPKEKMSVIGYLDFHMAEQAQHDMLQNPALKEKSARNHGIDMAKKTIIVFSSPYNTKDVTFLSDAEQYNYIESIFKNMWEVLPKNEYNFLLKIHPAENKALYKDLADQGVTIFGKQENNFELIALSDLYISDSTTTNFIPIFIHKEAIFINFLRLKMIDMAKDCYGVNAFVSDAAEFKALVKDWKEGHLKQQYTLDDAIYTKNSLDKMIQWIG